MPNNKKEKIIKIIEQFEHGLCLAGLDAENVNYDILAGVRNRCWNDLEELTDKQIDK